MDELDKKQDETESGDERENKRRSGSVPEIGFSRSTSGLSSEGSDLQERSGSDSTTEYLMTAKEIQELDQRLQETVDRLQKQREDYEKWENDLNRRRLLAFGRLKALGRFHRQRMEVYETVKNYVHDMNAVTHGQIDMPQRTASKK